MIDERPSVFAEWVSSPPQNKDSKNRFQKNKELLCEYWPEIINRASVDPVEATRSLIAALDDSVLRGSLLLHLQAARLQEYADLFKDDPSILVREIYNQNNQDK
jgi:hypothetical protein